MKKLFGIIFLALLSVFMLTSCDRSIIAGETTITDMEISTPTLPVVLDCGKNGTMTINEFTLGKITYKAGIGYILPFTIKAETSGDYFKVTLAHYDEDGNELGKDKYEYLVYKHQITYIDVLSIDRKTTSVQLLPNYD